MLGVLAAVNGGAATLLWILAVVLVIAGPDFPEKSGWRRRQSRRNPLSFQPTRRATFPKLPGPSAFTRNIFFGSCAI